MYKTKQQRMKGDVESGAEWGRASGRGSPQRNGGAGWAMGARHAGDILRRCPQKSLGVAGGGAGRERQEGRLDLCPSNVQGPKPETVPGWWTTEVS